MKILYLLRHAKSSWDDPGLRDFERPLSERGARDVPVMAARFLERGGAVQRIITSPAVRARTTARLMAENIRYPVDGLVSNPELYLAGTGMYLKAASLVDEDCGAAMLVGHNPSITEFVNLMADAGIDNIPTCGLAALELPVDSWADVRAGGATLAEFDYPKKAV